MAETIRVTHIQDDRFEVAIRDHTLYVDQPVDAGGADTGPTPTELFVAGLASCVGFYARRFLDRHELPTSGLAVETSFTMASNPARVGQVSLTVCLPEGLSTRDQAALLAVASHCTVHNSLSKPPNVDIVLSATCTRLVA